MGKASAAIPPSIPSVFLLSVIIPAFNEEATIAEVIRRVRACGLPCEIVVINDGSTDRTKQILDSLPSATDLQIVHQPRNQGKGAALKLGFSLAQGDVIIIQDADWEYHPSEYSQLVPPIFEGEADVVYGSRLLGKSRMRLWHSAGNRLLTWLSNTVTGLRLTDMETGYKTFHRTVIDRVGPTLREQGFGIEPELTAKIARLPEIRVVERPINYTARTVIEGKKIGWKDGVWAIWCILRYGLL